MITPKFTAEQVAETMRLVRDSAHIVVFTHMSPDGDAMGSSLGISHWIRTVYPGKDVTVVVPNAYPEFFRWMPGAADVVQHDTDKDRAEQIVAAADLIICTDFGEAKRVGFMAPLLEAATCPKIMIDHHLNPSGFAQVAMSRPEASSASELVLRLLLQAGECEHIGLDTATCLYTGMMTDTGSFSYNSNDPELYELVGELLRRGVDKDACYDRVFNIWSLDRMRLMGYCLLRKLQVMADGKTALIYLTRKELYRFNFSSGDAEGLVNLPLQMANIRYSCFMREDKDKVKISFRSQGDRPVNEYAHAVFHGGGHANAAGGEFYGPVTEAVKLFVNTYADYFRA
ncbi:MAG: DHH family phosphoesterase [Paludibacteraceae bacterium]|nr:DHH family phosphoesterase [Paludibacteraceae bacterium]